MTKHRHVLVGSLLSCSLAASVSAVPLEVSLRPATPPASEALAAAQVHLRPVDGSQSVPMAREVPLTEPAVFPAEPASVWEVTIAAPGYWSRPEVVTVGPEGARVVVDMLPAGVVAGEVRVPRGLAVPTELTLRFRSAPEVEPGLSEVSEVCPVAQGRFRCAVPAGWLDLRFRARGHITHYRWGARVPQGGTLDVGVLELQPGASVVGWVEPPDRATRSSEVTLELAPQAATGLFSPAEAKRRTALTLSGKPNDRGFFELAGVAPGSYVLVARHPHFAPARISPVRVEPGAETEVHRIVLEPPATLEVRLDPPRDPWDRVWQVQLLQVGDVAEHPSQVADTTASPDGVFRATGLEPGPYRLHVTTGRWARWHYQDIEVAPGMAPVEARLPAMVVEGIVTLAGEPIKAVVWWGGSSGAVGAPTTSGGDGRFAITLPKRATWRVEVVSAPLHVHHTIPALDVDLEADPVRVDIEIPDLSIRGDVVDEAGRPVSKPAITVEGPPGHLLQIDGDEEGRFEIRGAVPGEWTIEARAAGLIADGVTVELGDASSVQGLRLVVKKPRQVSGLVVGPDGQGVSGAIVIGRLEPHQRHLWVGSEQQKTTIDGQFRMRLPPGADSVQLTVFAPGFAVTQRRADPASKEPVVIPVRQTGGTLVLDYDQALDDPAKRHAVKLFGAFEVGSRHAIDGWLRLHGLDPTTPGRLVVPMLAPGTYTACLDVGFLATIHGGTPPAGATPRCVSGELAAGGELSLEVPAPPPERSAEAAPLTGH